MTSKYTLGYDKNKEFTIESSDTLILPYVRSDATSVGYLLKQTGSVPSGVIHSYLVINNNTTLNVNGKIYVGGVVYSTSTNNAGVVSSRAIVMNNGNIICNSGAEVLSYGYIKGQNGIIEFKNGSTLVDVFRVFDYTGGMIANKLKNNDIFPVQVYSFHNVSCEVKINYGAKLNVYGQISNSDDEIVMSENITILGKGGLFELTEANGYILKSVEDTTSNTLINSSFTSSNQDKTQREVLNIHGSFKDNSISLKVEYMGMTITITTSTSMPMPIGMMKVILNEGTGELSSVSYKFLPGSEFIINDGATLKIGSKTKVVFYDSSYNDKFTYNEYGSYPTTCYFRYSDLHSAWFKQSASKIASKLTVNGYLEVAGYLGGKIDSTSNGKIKLSNNSVTIPELKSATLNGVQSSASAENKTYYAKGLINGYDIETFDSSVTYYYTEAGYWSQIGSHSITFDSLGGTTFETIKFTSSVDSSNKVTTDLDKSLNFNSKYIPVKTGYTFAGWYIDNAYNYPANINNVMGTITLYAKWNANEYTITYNLNGGVLPNSYPAYHTYGKTTILPIPTKDDYNFSGWYLTSALNTNGASGITSLDGTSYTDKIVLYARWEKDLKTYYVNLVDEVNQTNDSASLEDETGTGVALGKVCNEPNTDKDINFKGWYDANGNKYDSTSTITSGITLYAKWQCTVTYNANGGTLNGNPVDTYDYGAKTSKPTNPTPKDNYTFIKWTDESENEFTFGNTITSNITLKAYYEKDSCFASGTIITLADGTKKKIEDVTIDDVLLVFDHENGVYTSAPIIFIENDGMNYYEVITLKFDNGTISRIIYEHAFFDLTLNKYVYITANNYTDYIGHSFAVYDEELKTYSSTVLVESSLEEEYTGCYSLVTTYHMNYFIDGLFSFPGGIEGLFNYFEYDETLKYDESKMEADILEYGLYTYDDFKDYIPYEIFEYVFPTKYFKVAVGKGMITFDEILSLIERYLVGHGII